MLSLLKCPGKVCQLWSVKIYKRGVVINAIYYNPPFKSFLGKIAKMNLQTHIDKKRSKSNLTEWLNSKEVIKWFNNFNFKSHKCFINFDIKKFNPSIKKNTSPKLLNLQKNT